MKQAPASLHLKHGNQIILEFYFDLPLLTVLKTQPKELYRTHAADARMHMPWLFKDGNYTNDTTACV